jgi:hypothetical protein
MYVAVHLFVISNPGNDGRLFWTFIKDKEAKLMVKRKILYKDNSDVITQIEKHSFLLFGWYRG